MKDYIINGFVEIINFRGLVAAQLKEYQDCYKNNYKKYDWLIFFDMDEFIFLKNYKNIKKFLKKKIFDKCQRIQLNWIFHTDNNLLYYDSRNVLERFTEKEPNARNRKIGGSQEIKSMVPTSMKEEVNIFESPERQYSAWQGGSILSSVSTFESNWITRKEYYEFGPDKVQEKIVQ